MKGCLDLEKLGYKFQCCSSCHYDDDEWGYEMCYVEIKGEEYYVCCAAAQVVKE